MGVVVESVKAPWRVEYLQRFPEWDPRSCPVVVDRDGEVVLSPPSYVDHPGLYDERADFICQAAVCGVNGLT